LKELYELRKLSGEHPQFVQAWTSDRDAITREQVAALRADLSRPNGDRTAALGPRASPATAAAAEWFAWLTRQAKVVAPQRREFAVCGQQARVVGVVVPTACEPRIAEDVGSGLAQRDHLGHLRLLLVLVTCPLPAIPT
jgi:hypothetical protein